MTFVTIAPARYEVGDPVTADLVSDIVEDLNDLNTRTDSLETTNKKIDIFKFMLLNGSSFSTATGLAYYRAEDNFTITKGAIQIFEKGSLAGTLELDVKKSTTNLDGPSFTTIFTTKPAIVYASAADYDESTNQVINSSSAIITAGDYLRLDITSAPTGGVIPKILVTVYGE